MADSTFAAVHTLVIADNGELGATTLQGQTGLDANTTIVAIAHNGDATLDGKVGAAGSLEAALADFPVFGAAVGGRPKRDA